jgi:hypothetical protein
MKCFKIQRCYRRTASTLTDTASGIAHLHNIILAGPVVTEFAFPLAC